MKVYLDTTVITLLLFGAQTDPIRHREVTDFFLSSWTKAACGR